MVSSVTKLIISLLASVIGRPKKSVISFLISHYSREAGSSLPVFNVAGRCDTLKKVLLPVEKHKRRLDSTLSSPSYLEFLKYYNFAKLDWIPKPRPGDRVRILLYFPEYKLSEGVEDFARVKVKRHHPLPGVNQVTSSSRANTVMGSMIRSKICL